MNWYFFLQYASIPISGAIIGWATNWLAIRMTFYPIRYIGIRPLGWQGIIPSKAHKMAEKAVDLLTAKLLKMEERFAQIDAKIVAEQLFPAMQRLSKQMIDELMEAQFRQFWANTPRLLKEQVYQHFSQNLPTLLEQVIEDMKQHILDLVNIKTMSIEAIEQNKALLNEIFLRCGKKEFQFIILSGLYFGLPLGLVQMILSIHYQPWWLLPLFGLLVGYLTNWLALRMVFKPLHPRIILGYSFQGLFLKRQMEVSVEYAHFITEKILTTENIFEFMIRGAGAYKMSEIIEKNMETIILHTLRQNVILRNLPISDAQTKIMNNIVCFRFKQELPIAIRGVFQYAEYALDMENILRERMQNLAPEEFERFLRPAFQEDEWILIAVGAVLGGLAGFGQYFALFAQVGI